MFNREKPLDSLEIMERNIETKYINCSKMCLKSSPVQNQNQLYSRRIK